MDVQIGNFDRDWGRALARAAFDCAECGEVAARVALVVDQSEGVTSTGGQGGLISEAGFYGEWVQVVLEPGLLPVARALEARDASALYEIEPLWAPFYCPECRRCYCHEHWVMRVVFDEEWSSWYDYTDGTCPRGHRRMIDD